MKNFQHPNVLNVIGVSLDTGVSPYIVMPYMANGSLLAYLKKERANLTMQGDDPVHIVNVASVVCRKDYYLSYSLYIGPRCQTAIAVNVSTGSKGDGIFG